MKLAIVILFLLGGFVSPTLSAQEVRVQGNMLILGYINDPFVGAGVGFETGLGQHFTLNMDVNLGSHEDGSSLELRPAVNYYVGQEQKGIFGGVAFKYISLNEKDEDVNNWEDHLYSIGINLGFKAVMQENWTLTFIASPHKTVGGHTEGDVAGISAQLAVGYRF